MTVRIGIRVHLVALSVLLPPLFEAVDTTIIAGAATGVPAAPAPQSAAASRPADVLAKDALSRQVIDEAIVQSVVETGTDVVGHGSWVTGRNYEGPLTSLPQVKPAMPGIGPTRSSAT